MLVERHNEYSGTSHRRLQPQLRSGPHQARFTQNLNPGVEADTTTLKNITQQGQHHHIIRGLQAVLRRKQLADPNLSQSHIFRFCAPLAIFLYLFVIGVTLPRGLGTRAQVTDIMERTGTFGAISAVLALGVGALLVLVVLRALVWMLAKVLRSFCEWDLSGPNGIDGKLSGDYEFSQANLLFGGLFM